MHNIKIIEVAGKVILDSMIDNLNKLSSFYLNHLPNFEFS